MSGKDMNFGGWRHYSTQYRTFADCHHTAGVPQSMAASLVLEHEREGWPWGERGVGDKWEGKGLCEALPAKGCDEGQSAWNLHPREDRAWELGRETQITRSQLGSSLEPNQNCIPGLATTDGPAHPLRACGVWLAPSPAWLI